MLSSLTTRGASMSYQRTFNRLDEVTDRYVPPTEDNSKKEMIVLLVSKSDPQHYYVMRRQDRFLRFAIRDKEREGFVQVLQFEEPNAMNTYNRLKELNDNKIKCKFNNVYLDKESK
jgi:hypothetical protein